MPSTAAPPPASRSPSPTCGSTSTGCASSCQEAPSASCSGQRRVSIVYEVGAAERAIVVAAQDAGSVVCASTRATEDAGSGREGRSALPAVVGEGLVRLRHAEDVVLALERAALLGLRVEQLVGEPLGHRLLAALAGGTGRAAGGGGGGGGGGGPPRGPG